MKHSPRNDLLKISPQHSIEGKFYSQIKENKIIKDAEQIFHKTFSNEFFNRMANVLNMYSNGDTISIEDPINNIVVPIKVCLHFSKFISKTKKRNKNHFCVFVLFLQEINSDKKDEA